MSEVAEAERFRKREEEMSVLLHLTLGHSRYLLTVVPPQANSAPDKVLERWRER